MEKTLATIFAATGLVFSLTGGQIEAQDFPAYRSEWNIVYSMVAGKDLKLNAFLPTNATAPAPAVVEIHGSWWFGGAAGADATYWMTPGGGHAFPGGAGFEKVLDDFLVRTLQLDSTTNDERPFSAGQ